MLVLHRCATCSREAQRLVEAASVLGLQCSLATAARLASVDDPLQALEEASRAGLLQLRDAMLGGRAVALRGSSGIPRPAPSGTCSRLACELRSSSWSSRKRIGARDLLATRAAYSAPAVNWRLRRSAVAGIERRGCGGCPVAAGDHIVGEIDESTASWFGKGDHLVGRDLAWTGPGLAVVCGDALLSCDFSFSLGAHGDHARRSSQCWICGGYLARKVRDIHRTNHAEMEAFQRPLQINAASDLIWRGPTSCSARGCRHRRSNLAGGPAQGWVGMAVLAG